MSGPPSVTVVVVCWNCRADIERCLSCLAANTRYPSWRLLIIDNLSADGTREWLSALQRAMAAAPRTAP